LALSDGQVEHDRLTPAALAVLAVEISVGVGVRKQRSRFVRQIDAGTLTHPEFQSTRDEIREPELQPELVEVDVARLLDRASERNAAVSLVIPTAKIAAAE